VATSRSPSAGAAVLRHPSEVAGADRQRGTRAHRPALCSRSRHSRPLRR
jgi:hypothetical protein